MPRLVIHDDTGPVKLSPADVDPEKDNIAVCQCGLSAEFPFCDGTHRQTRDESEQVLYRYDPDEPSERYVVTEISTEPPDAK